MKRISTTTRVVNKFGAGKDGFTNGDVGGAIPATDLEDVWFDHVQEEICSVVEGAGLTLNPASYTQLLQAIQALGAAPGRIDFFARNTAPTGYLKANGALVSRVTYAALFAAIGTNFGVGDGTTTFGLPDLRGEFVRSWDDGRGIDAARAFGSAQAANVGAHSHQIEGLLDVTYGGGGSARFVPGSASVAGSTIGNPTGETRPRNIALLACIKI